MQILEKKTNNRFLFWLAVFAIFCIFVYLTRSVVMPFAAGILIGYLFNPLIKKMAKYKINRTFATCIVLGLLIIAIVPTIILVIGILNEQISRFITSLPTLVPVLVARIEPMFEKIGTFIPELAPENIKESLQSNTSNAVKIVTSVATKIVRSSFAFVNVISLMVITPIVAFYMMRDWNIFTKKIDDLFPVKSREEIRDIFRQTDKAMSGFIRGQFSVCLILGSIYSIGLYIVGLQLGVAVGLIAGIISFIPYVGTISGFVAAMIIAFIQFDSIGPILQVVTVFAIGQFLESNFLTPKLVGDSVGLHPVWIMFSILAGGVILGFLGIMIAVPVAAIISILIKHFIKKYKKSQYYKG